MLNFLRLIKGQLITAFSAMCKSKIGQAFSRFRYRTCLSIDSSGIRDRIAEVLNILGSKGPHPTDMDLALLSDLRDKQFVIAEEIVTALRIGAVGKGKDSEMRLILPKFSLISGYIRLGLLKNKALPTPQLIDLQADYRARDSYYSQLIRSLILTSSVEFSNLNRFATVHTKGSNIVFEYYAPELVSEGDQQVVASVMGKYMEEMLYYLYHWFGYRDTAEWIYMKAELLLADETTYTLLPRMRIRGYGERCDPDVRKRIAANLAAYRTRPLYSYTTAQHQGIFIFTFSVSGPQVTETGLWPEHIRVLAEKGVTVYRDRHLLSRNNLPSEGPLTGAWERENVPYLQAPNSLVSYLVQLTPEKIEYSNTFRPFQGCSFPGTMNAFIDIAFKGPVDEPSPHVLRSPLSHTKDSRVFGEASLLRGPLARDVRAGKYIYTIEELQTYLSPEEIQLGSRPDTQSSEI